MKVSPLGSGAAALASVSLFADREAEAQAFANSLVAFRSVLDGDGETPVGRQNILAFYGVGGIGKTTLSSRLETWVSGRLSDTDRWGPTPTIPVATTARVDLHGSAGQIDLAATLVALRAGVAGIRRRWPVFDLAFAAYWSAVRPGEALPNFPGHAEVGAAVAETISDVLSDIGGLADLTGVGTGTGLGLRAVRKVVSVVRQRIDIRRALGAFDGFDDFLLRCAEEPSPSNAASTLVAEIAGILAWELSTMSPTPLVVVFVDTTERLALDARRVGEGYLNDLVYRMPNVLFVMTGRNRLGWDDSSRSDLPYPGSWYWPGLSLSAQDEPRQHLVGALTNHDARQVIQRARAQFELPISDAVVDELVASSAGLPQYLELARQVAISIKAANDGRQITKADVTGSLGSLVHRVLDDMPQDEQRAIRAAALFRAFDAQLIAAAAQVDHGCVERALRRPVVEAHSSVRFPFRLHDAVREAIRHGKNQGFDEWNEQDWAAASTRAAAVLQELHASAKRSNATRETLDAVGAAINLVCDQPTALGPAPSAAYADWLTQAIVFSPSIQGLKSRVTATSVTEYGAFVLDFIRAKSVETPFDQRLSLLRGVFDSDHPLRLPAGRHLGYTLKLLHQWSDAIAVFREVVAIAPTELNLGQEPLVLNMSRRFADARNAAEGQPIAGSIRRVQEYTYGLPQRYFDEIPATMLRLRDQGRQRELLEEESDLVIRRALLRGNEVTADELSSLEEKASQAGHLVAMRGSLTATVLDRRCGIEEIASALPLLKVLETRSSATGAIGFRYALAEICDSVIASDTDARLATLGEEIGELAFRTRAWIPVECLMDWLGVPLSPMPTQWLDSYEVVRERWVKHFESYLSWHGCALPRPPLMNRPLA